MEYWRLTKHENIQDFQDPGILWAVKLSEGIRSAIGCLSTASTMDDYDRVNRKLWSEISRLQEVQDDSCMDAAARNETKNLKRVLLYGVGMVFGSAGENGIDGALADMCGFLEKFIRDLHEAYPGLAGKEAPS